MNHRTIFDKGFGDESHLVPHQEFNPYDDILNQTKALSKITITNFLIQETGTYNDVQQRPYRASLDHHSLANIVERSISDNGPITGSRLAGTVGGILQPKAGSDGNIIIANGWNSKRIRFFLAAKCSFSFGSEVVYYFQGYSDYNGISQQQRIDPNMVFYINSYIKVSSNLVNTPLGMVQQERVVAAKHLIAPNVWTDSNNYGMSTGPGSSIAMRPHDVFRGMQTLELHDNLNSVFDSTGHYDARVGINSVINSDRSHSLPSNYVAKVIDAYVMGVKSNTFGESASEIYNHVLNNTGEESPGENPLLRALSNFTGTGLINNFTFPLLQKIDANVQYVTNVQALSAVALSKVHNVGSTSYWTGSDRETVVATILANAVPTIMMELMIQTVQFRSTNHDIGGNIVTAVINGNCLTNQDFTNAFEMFKRRLEVEVIRDITFNNEESYSLEMSCNLYGETRISISLAGQPRIDFVNPSFCDSLFLPVITKDSNGYNSLVENFKTIVTQVADNREMNHFSGSVNSNSILAGAGML